MNKSITQIILFFVIVAVIFFILDMYTKYICDKHDKSNKADKLNEQFIDNYYHWDWNDPNMLTKINLISNKPPCEKCTYSMSCDFTDDAQPFCKKSYDIPSEIREDKKMLHHMSY
jgi:hypothetical protein